MAVAAASPGRRHAPLPNPSPSPRCRGDSPRRSGPRVCAGGVRADRGRSRPPLSPAQIRVGQSAPRGHAPLLERPPGARGAAGGREPRCCLLPAELGGVPPPPGRGRLPRRVRAPRRGHGDRHVLLCAEARPIGRRGRAVGHRLLAERVRGLACRARTVVHRSALLASLRDARRTVCRAREDVHAGAAGDRLGLPAHRRSFPVASVDGGTHLARRFLPNRRRPMAANPPGGARGGDGVGPCRGGPATGPDLGVDLVRPVRSPLRPARDLRLPSATLGSAGDALGVPPLGQRRCLAVLGTDGDLRRRVHLLCGCDPPDPRDPRGRVGGPLAATLDSDRGREPPGRVDAPLVANGVLGAHPIPGSRRVPVPRTIHGRRQPWARFAGGPRIGSNPGTSAMSNCAIVRRPARSRLAGLVLVALGHDRARFGARENRDRRALRGRGVLLGGGPRDGACGSVERAPLVLAPHRHGV